MKVRIGLSVACVMCLALASLLLAADSPKGDADKPLPDPLIYAKPEVQGELISTHEDWEPMYIVIASRPKEAKLPLVVSDLKRWSKERFEKAHGKPVRVNGTPGKRSPRHHPFFTPVGAAARPCLFLIATPQTTM